jgi:hypothetical protein
MFGKTWTAVLLMLLMGSAGGALRAQTPAPAPASPSVNKAPTVDVNKLPMDLQRLQQKLRETANGSQKEPLVMRFQVNVFAQAPRIDLFSPDELKKAPVRTVTPTHRELMNSVTPVPWSRR